MTDTPPENQNPESSEQPFRQYNPDWNQDVFENPDAAWNRQYEWKSTGPRPWYQVFRDFLTMGSDGDCAYLLDEPTADYGHAYGWFAMVSGFIVVLFIVILAILPSDSFGSTGSSPTFGNTRTTEEQLNPGDLLGFYCVTGPLSIVLNIVIYTIGLGIVHVIATSLFNARGEFEKLIYGVFTLFTAYYAASILFIVPLIILGVIVASVPCLSLFFLLAILAVVIYIYYLYTMVVKTVYKLGWWEAFLSAILIPIGGGALLYCGCIFCFASSSGGA